jgi:ribonucleotide reductase beta subunit family protein with ferritin-like domain
MSTHTSHHTQSTSTGVGTIKTALFDPLPSDTRLTTFPIARPTLFEWYKDSTRCFWTVEEVSTTVDKMHYETKLTPGERHFVKHVLAFFAASDGIVNLNIAERFKKDVQMLEAGYFYDFQIMMENTHAHMYSILLSEIIPSNAERNTLLNAITTMPIITKMSNYMMKCVKSTAPFAERLLRQACVEGIFFTGCFCAIYWLAQRGLMPGLSMSNEFIARDEALHTMFAMFLYTMLHKEHKLSPDRVRKIVQKAVKLAIEFIREALPTGLAGMNADLMIPFIENQADNLITLIDIPPMYNSKHDFHFMDQQNLTNRTNFFERRVSEYSKVQQADDDDFEIGTDF